MEKIKDILHFIIDNRFIFAFILLFIMLIIQLIVLIPLFQKFKEMENIPVGEAEAEARFNELNRYHKSSSFSNYSSDTNEDEIQEFNSDLL